MFPDLGTTRIQIIFSSLCIRLHAIRIGWLFVRYALTIWHYIFLIFVLGLDAQECFGDCHLNLGQGNFLMHNFYHYDIIILLFLINFQCFIILFQFSVIIKGYMFTILEYFGILLTC